MTPTKSLARFASALDPADVEREVVERAQHLILDGLGCGFFGSKLEWAERAVEALAPRDEGDGLVLGWNRATDPVGAATLNGTFVNGFELDDYHVCAAGVHSSSCVLSALVACLPRVRDATGADFLAAVLAGYETGPRVGIALGGYAIVVDGWNISPIAGTIASAVGVSRLLRLDARETEHAVGIAATQASGLMSAQYEAMVKRMVNGFAARNGVLSALLAESGFTGIDDVLEREYGGFAAVFTRGHGHAFEQLTEGLGRMWELLDISVKPYSSMAGTHTAIEAMARIRDGARLDPGEIEAIEIGQSNAMHLHAGWSLERPLTATAAQMNIAYAVAAAALEGRAFVGQYAPERLNADDSWELIDRVRTYREPKFDPPGREFGCVLTVRTRSGETFVEEIDQPLGSSARPLANEELLAKFRDLAAFVVDREEQEAIVDAVLSLPEAPDLTQLERALRVTARMPYALT